LLIACAGPSGASAIAERQPSTRKRSKWTNDSGVLDFDSKALDRFDQMLKLLVGES